MMGFGISVDGGTSTETVDTSGDGATVDNTNVGDPLGLGAFSAGLHLDLSPLNGPPPAAPPPPAISLNLGGLLARNGLPSLAPATAQSTAVDASKAAVAAGAAPSTPFYKQPAVVAAGAAVVVVGVGRALWRHFHR